MAKKPFFRREIIRWSLVEYQYLIENFDKLSMEELCKDLLKPEYAIISAINDLKLHGKTSKKGPSPKARIIRVCEYCHTAFITQEYIINRGDGKFCSTYCTQTSQKLVLPSKSDLEKDYIDNKLSTNDIAEKYNISKGTVYNLFKKYKISGRSLSDSVGEFFKSEKGYATIKNRLVKIQAKYGTTCLSNVSDIKRGYREDINIAVRSSWEANVLRLFNYQKIKWEYEPKTFFYNGVRKGAISYTPDIYLPEQDIWIEIKGYLRPQDKSKIRKMKEFFPEEFKKLRYICKCNTPADKFFKEMGVPIIAYYNELDKEYKDTVPNWE